MDFTVFHSTATDTMLWEAADGRGNFLITASSKDKTFCHLLYSLQKQKPPVKTSKPSKPAVIYYTAFKNKNHLSKSSKPAVKTCCQNIKTIKTTCQNHQNLLSKHQNHQNHLSKSSKPTVNNIKTIKTTCQNHQNLLSIT